MIEAIYKIIPILAPLALDYSLLRLKTKSGIIWILLAWLAISITGFFFLTGGWFIFSQHLRTVMAGVCALCVIISLLRLPRNTWTLEALRATDLSEVFGNLLPALIMTFLTMNAWMGQSAPESGISLQFPLKGDNYLFVQAGASGLVNHHYGAGSQKFAQDIVQLNPIGRSSNRFSPSEPDDYVIFGQPVYSPCNGVVHTVVDGLMDLPTGTPGDEKNTAGNHVYIKCDSDDVYVLLAHIQQGSIQVVIGNKVKSGEMAARVGNSGNTTEPHLHIHARRGGDLTDLTDGTGVPIFYEEIFYSRNDLVTWK